MNFELSKSSTRIHKTLASDFARQLDLELSYEPTDLSGFVNSYSGTIHKQLGARAVSVWSHDAVNQRLIHVTTCGLQHPYRRRVLHTARALCGEAVEKKRPIIKRLRESGAGGRHDTHESDSVSYGLQWMISVPILNVSNSNQVLYLTNLLFGEEPNIAVEDLLDCADIFASRHEAVLHESCYRKSNLLQIELAKRAVEGCYSELSRALADSIESCIATDAVGIFLTNKSDVLTLDAFGRAGLRHLARHNTFVLGTAEGALKSNRERIVVNDIDGSASHPVSLIAVPIRNLMGRAVGAIVCLKNVEDDGPVAFTYDDATYIEVLGQVFAPYHELMTSENQRLEALSRLGHELKGPISGNPRGT